MSNHEQIDQGRREWRGKPPASESAIQMLLRDCGLALPEAYLAFLRRSNGAEGQIGVSPGWLRLWSAEEIVEVNRAYGVQDSVPGFFGFGTDGGGELFAFRLKASQPWQVYMIPFITL